MDRRIYHGSITPADIARSLIAEFDRGNLRAQVLGQGDDLAVQIGTRPGATSGGQTALTVTIRKAEDGVLVQAGSQEWLGTAASLGQTTIAALANPWNLLHRLDDLAQDVENMQLMDRVWAVIGRTASAIGAGAELSERLRRIACEYCGTANAVGAASCIACGAPLGDSQPATCPNCGFVVSNQAVRCPNCGANLLSRGSVSP
jgi:DNA-directed RNA polymerase subunit RPC12/RpoP